LKCIAEQETYRLLSIEDGIDIFKSNITDNLLRELDLHSMILLYISENRDIQLQLTYDLIENISMRTSY